MASSPYSHWDPSSQTTVFVPHPPSNQIYSKVSGGRGKKGGPSLSQEYSDRRDLSSERSEHQAAQPGST
ncbi:hypothetical protein KY285_024564 [Solanum tuberosum]|nr:hypothetical protein KY285_024564 [Solanum tuberosum]